MRDELADGDLLRHLVVEVLAVEHHGLQDGQGALQHGGVHGRLVHVTGDLQQQTVWVFVPRRDLFSPVWIRRHFLG